MKSETKIILCVLILVIIIFCAFKKEKFDTSASPSPSPSPSTSPSTSPSPSISPSTSSSPSISPSTNVNSLLSADNAVNNLKLFANNLTSVNTKNVTPSNLEDVKTQLTDQINQLSTILNSINNNITINNNSNNNNNLENVNGIDLITTQMLQNKEIEKLTERLNKLKGMHQEYQQKTLIDTQPRIPIYSSCITSEASGSYSFDNLNKSSDSGEGQEKPIVYANQNVSPGIQSYNPNRNVNLNSQSFNLEDILNELAQSNINVNFNA